MSPTDVDARGPRNNRSTSGAAMAIKVGVMGGAADITERDRMERAHALGAAVARAGCVLITGACPGLPLAAACGAKQAGGFVVGISPGQNLSEHVQTYQSPTEFHDVLIYTGSGLMGREVINIRSSDVVVIVGGRSGTLGELAIAYDEGKPIGVLKGMGGISDLVPDIIAACKKETGAEVIYDDDPGLLVERLLSHLETASAREADALVARDGREADAEYTRIADPVCGMCIVPSAAAAERTWHDRRFFFCSKACADEFDATPARFAHGDPR